MSGEYPEILRGIGIPWTRIGAGTIYAADSDYTESEPEAGTVTSSSQMRIDATGTPSAGIDVRCQSAGLAGRAGARFVARPNGGEWVGWDLPVGIRNREVLASIAGTTTPTDHTSCVASPGGAVLVAEARYSSGVNTVRVHRQVPGEAWSTTAAALATSENNYIAAPSLCVLSTGRVLLFVMVYDTGANLAQVRQLYSDNDGVSFSVGADYVLPESLDSSTITVERMASAESGGQVSLVLSIDDGSEVKPYQYASNDQGSSFALVSDALTEFGGSDVGSKYWDVAGMVGGGFMLSASYTSNVSGSGTVLSLSLTISGAFEPINNGAFTGGLASGILISGAYQQWPALCRDDTGSVWLHVIGKGAGVGQSTVTRDNGLSWSPIGNSETSSTAGQWWDTGALEAGPWGMSSAYLYGSVYVAHYTAEVSAVEGGQSPAVLQLGGYTSVTLPAVDQFVSNTNGLAYSLTYAGMSSPTDYGLSLAGTATESQDGDGWLTVEVSGALVSYTDATATDHVTGQLHHIVCERVIGDLFLQSVVSDGTDAYGVEITWGASGISILDLSGANGFNLPSAEFNAVTGAAEFIIAVSASGYTIGIRPAGNAETPFYTVQNPITAVGGSTSERFRWGTVPDGNPPNRFKTITYARAVSSDFATSIANDFTSPDDLRGFPLSGVARYVVDGVSLAAVGGPAAVADSFSMPVRYAYPIANLWSDSKQDEWRSVSDAANMAVAFEVETLDEGEAPSEGLAYILVQNANVKEFVVEQTDGISSSYSIELADVSLAESFAMYRTGHQVTPARTGATIAGRRLKPDQLKGSHFEFPSGEVVPITGNTGGYLTSGSTVAEKRATIYLERGTVTNGTSTTGTGEVWHKDAVIYMHDADDVAGRVRIRIHHDGAPSTYTGDFRFGTLEFGAIRPFSRAYDWGRRIGYRSNVEITTLANGSTRARRLGERARNFALTWNEGLITAECADAPVYSAASTQPVASSRDTASMVSTLPDAGDIVSYHPRIPEGPAVYVDLSGDVIRGRLGDVTWESIVGTEGVDELVRIGLTGDEVL